MRQLVLALLAGSGGHGYDLRRSYERNFGSVWTPINEGQVYVTLSRLEKEGLVQPQERADARQSPEKSRAESSEKSRSDRKDYEITEPGRELLLNWLNEKPAPPNLRSETMLRILAAAASGLADHQALIVAARKEYRLALRRVDELRAEAEDPIRALLVESASLQLDADLRWLDVAEQELRNLRPRTNSTASTSTASPSTPPTSTSRRPKAAQS
jgi:DNA-binding PadR family transcriptional regulator